MEMNFFDELVIVSSNKHFVAFTVTGILIIIQCATDSLAHEILVILNILIAHILKNSLVLNFLRIIILRRFVVSKKHY